MNICILTATLSRMPEVKATTSGLEITTLYLTDTVKGYKDKPPKIEHYKAIAFGARTKLKELRPGQKVMITGRLSGKSMNDRNGNEVVYQDFLIDEAELIVDFPAGNALTNQGMPEFGTFTPKPSSLDRLHPESGVPERVKTHANAPVPEFDDDIPF